MSVVRWWVVHPVVGGRRWGWGVPLVYECCKMDVSYFLWVGGRGVGVPLVYECCKMVVGTSCGLG